jgi:hypothetical protein
MKRDLTETACDVVDWIHVPQDMDQWRTIFNTTVDTDSHKMSSNFFTAIIPMFPLSTGSELNFGTEVKRSNTLHKSKKNEQLINVS